MEPNASILYASATHGTWILNQIWIKSIHFCLEISQDKVPIVAQIWHRTKCCLTSMINAWYLINVPNMHKITCDILLWDITTNSKFIFKMAIITQVWHGAKFYFASTAHDTDHGTIYEENPASHDMEAYYKDGLTDEWMARLTDQVHSYIPRLRYWRVGNNITKLYCYPFFHYE